jgi:A/G-specific adenine glycosylase
LDWTRKLLLWYDENKRSLIWRATQEPYKIWISEVILQQTRAAQGAPYYIRFLQTFPTLESLASASEDQVLKVWQGLGYYSRARNLHFTAKYIQHELKGVFPHTFESLLELKGIGDYTASAISSICFGTPQAVVDGNVYRLLSRYFGIHTPINTPAALQEFKTKAIELMGDSNPGTFNQAMMEFGSLHCTPKKPKCSSCPFSSDCIAFNLDLIATLPLKLTRTKIRKRHFNYLVIADSRGHFLFEKRKEKGIWQNLYQFPLVESSQTIKSEKTLKAHPDFPKNISSKHLTVNLYNKTPIVHKLSHQNLYVNFWLIKTEIKLKNAYAKDDIKRLAVPVVIQNFIKKSF